MKTRLLTGLLSLLLPALVVAGEYDLTVDRVKIDTGDFVKEGIGYNGKSPGPVMRFKEGENVRINVTNNLDAGARVDVDPRKQSPFDFVLWKA
ncbi:MAG: multicopper oxidase domain-containing protein, partial [Marinobacter sp.]